MSIESSGALILRERRGAVAILTLNRPRALNALNAALLDALRGRRAFTQVPGLVFGEDDHWRRNVPDMDGPPDQTITRRRLADNAAYFRFGGQLGVETKRGCPGSCIYCADPVV